MTLQLALGLLLAASVSLTGVYIWGSHDGAAEYKQQLAELRRAANQQEAHYYERNRELHLQLAELQGQKRVVDTKLREVLDRPYYVGECLDPDGLRLANDALTGTEGGASHTMPPADPYR